MSQNEPEAVWHAESASKAHRAAILTICVPLRPCYKRRTRRRLAGRRRVLTSPTYQEVKMAAKCLCSIPDCDKPRFSREWCIMHYRRWQRHGDPSVFIQRKTTRMPYANRRPEYKAWSAMKSRCYRASHRDYHNYGGRGISVCARWVDSFDNFFADLGPRPSPRHSIDRWPDKDGNYEPNNCRWALPRQQMNNVRYNHIIVIDGEHQTAAQWCRKFGIARSTFDSRMRRGWGEVRALTTPPL